MSKISAQISDSLFRLALSALNERPDESAVVSPFSIAMAMAAANLGAKENTTKEITDVLFSGIPKNQITAWFRERLIALKDDYSPLSIASAIYLEKTLDLLDRYQIDLAQNFDSSVEKVDFSNDSRTQVAVINGYVEKATNGKIKELFSGQSITPLTRVVLVNALYLNARFDSKFDKQMTHEDIFNNEDGSTKEVPNMNGTKNGQFFENEDFAYAEIPFKNGGFSFFLIVPKTGRLSDLKEQFSSGNHSISSTDSGSEYIPYIHMTLPKFKAEASFDLAYTLQKLGVVDFFTPGAANLSGITGAALNADAVVHKAVFELHEEGVEAAAATGISIMLLSATIEESTEERFIKADRPFLYGVAYKGAPLFLGQFY
uniref:SERPIN domain-containing protein n=1 Tax=Steinernema glaseri TaxID=37863 RepID=A0A1I8A9T1_9BILA